MANFAISSGHGLKVRGARGPSPWGLDEVNEARRMLAEVARILSDGGHKVATFNEDKATSVSANLSNIVNWHKRQSGQHISIHYNAFQVTTTRNMGAEVCHRSNQALASKVSQAIASAGRLTNRGAKHRTNLAFLNGLANAILLEVCFVDSKIDCDLYRASFAKIAAGIAEAIGGVTAPPPPPSGRPVVKRGDRNAHVGEIQRVLGLPMDNDFGPMTEAGVKAFQRAHGAGADGIVGPVSWRLLDELELRLDAGDDGIPEDLEGAIDQMVIRSGVNSIQWPNRGRAPGGYYLGMAKTFALAVERYRKGDSAALIMAGAETGDASTDALTYLRAEFAAKGMQNTASGLDTLRHLFVLLVGLGMRESTGNHWKGKDPGASNTTADTCEAGLFQTSWNMNTASNAIRGLFEEYRVDPNGFRESFSVDVSPSAREVETYGTGTGTYYQWLAKYCPTFAALMTGVGLRLRRKHWGPINRREVTIDGRLDDLLADVQRLVENEEPATEELPEVEEPGHQQPEPNAPTVEIAVAVANDVVVKAPEVIEVEEFDGTPEVEIIVKAKGGVAVTLATGNPTDVADHELIGKVRHDG